MKRYISKSIILLLSVMISAVLSGIGVSAAGEVYTESDGIRTAYLASSGTVTLSDGKYLYTPEVSDTQTVLEVEWAEAVTEPGVFEINGKPSVFYFRHRGNYVQRYYLRCISGS